MPAPLLDDDGGLLQAVEDFTVEAFVAKLAIEALAVAVFPRAARFDVECFGSQLGEPAADHLGCHLGAVIRSDVFGNTALDHHVGHGLDDGKAVDAAGNPDRQTFPGELVDQRHQPKLAAVMGLGLDKIVGPHMVAVLWPQPDA